MKTLIKEIRLAAGMNQEQFANALGTTPLSINRWENGKTAPNKMAQTNLYNFCKERGIDLAQLIVESKSAAAEDGKLILYHGSKRESSAISHPSAETNAISVPVFIWEPQPSSR